jgi:hypothetical protein
MVAAMFALFVPDRLYDALPGPWRKPLPTELDAELQADDRLRQMEEVQ